MHQEIKIQIHPFAGGYLTVPASFVEQLILPLLSRPNTFVESKLTISMKSIDHHHFVKQCWPHCCSGALEARVWSIPLDSKTTSSGPRWGWSSFISTVVSLPSISKVYLPFKVLDHPIPLCSSPFPLLTSENHPFSFCPFSECSSFPTSQCKSFLRHMGLHIPDWT